jgi:type IV secretory pathway TrbF-like protein
MTKAQKEAAMAAAALGEQYGKTVQRFTKKIRTLGGDTAINLKSFMDAFSTTFATPTIKSKPKSKKASK